MLAQQRRHQTALTIEAPPLRAALPAIRAEVLSTRALILASAGRVDEARQIACELSGSTRAIEATVLIIAVSAVSALKLCERDAIDRILELEDIAFSTGGVDLLVTAYRSTPELLPILLRAAPAPERFGQLLKRAKDEDLAVAAGYKPTDDGHLRLHLTVREQEVYELLTQGLTNLQIARLLFITEATVKVHVHHVYDKLGVRSRTALAVQAALERSGQATSAIEGGDIPADS
jgi:DNA-binding CsgD family transcriptional regulator